MADRKMKFAILSYFQKGYSKATGGETCTINKYSAQWDADALIDSYTVDTLKCMIDRYFELSAHPSWKGFCRDAQKVWEGLIYEQLDRDERTLIKKRAREWMNE